jgi:hypothetical protein
MDSSPVLNGKETMTTEGEETNSLLSEDLRRDVELSFGNTDVQKLVLKYGRPFYPVPRPKGIRQRVRKGCFGNSFLVADDGRAIYAEGYAMTTSSRAPFQHAWNPVMASLPLTLL